MQAFGGFRDIVCEADDQGSGGYALSATERERDCALDVVARFLDLKGWGAAVGHGATGRVVGDDREFAFAAVGDLFEGDGWDLAFACLGVPKKVGGLKAFGELGVDDLFLLFGEFFDGEFHLIDADAWEVGLFFDADHEAFDIRATAELRKGQDKQQRRRPRGTSETFHSFSIYFIGTYETFWGGLSL